MRKGKVSENIISRSVIKTIKYKNKDYIIAGASLGGDASVTASGTVIGNASAGLMFSAESSWFGSEVFKFDVKRAFYNAINNVAAQCGSPKAVMVSLMLPKKSQEQDIKELMRFIAGLCKEENIEIAGGDTEVTDNVKSPIVNFSAFGEYISAGSAAREERDIVLAGDIAMSGTAAIAYLKYDELCGRFQKSYIEKALNTKDCMNSTKASVLAAKYGVRLMHDLSRGGICSGLWELAEKTGKGVMADLDSIPVRQETIEVCERYHLNPYKLISNGAVLMVTQNGIDLCNYLAQNDINAAVIGRLTENNDKVLVKNEEKRYIEPPKGDELYKILL